MRKPRLGSAGILIAASALLALSAVAAPPSPRQGVIEPPRSVSETKLVVRTVLHDPVTGPAAAPAAPARVGEAGANAQPLPRIVFLSAAFDGGPWDRPASPANELRSALGLLSLPAPPAEKVEMVWSSSREIYDPQGKFLRREDSRSREWVRRTVTLDGVDYAVLLRPKEIDPSRREFRFELEIARAVRGSGGLAAVEPVTRREILWGGNLAVGFIFPDKVWFLDVAIDLERSSSGGRIASGIYERL